MSSLAIPSLITLAAVVLYQATALMVGKARFEHKVKPPAIHGPEAFERVVRVQQNTLEQLVFFLPVFWLATLQSQAAVAAVLGLVWVAGRIAYAVGYIASPEKRGPGFGISILSSLALLVMALVGAIGQLL